MPLTEEEKDQPASNFTIESLLPEIRASVDAQLGRDSSADFSDVTLRRYLASQGPGDMERKTVREVLDLVARSAQHRIDMRPGPGSAKRARAMPDDPVGIAMDRQRFDALAAEIHVIEANFQRELEIAKRRPAVRNQ